MNRVLPISLLALSLLSPALADTETGDAGATIITPLMVMAWEELYFGTIAPDTGTSADVTLSTDGARTCPSPLSCPFDDAQPARFAVAGETDRAYTVTLPTSVTLSGPNGAIMQADNFSSEQLNGTLVNGKDEFWVGGTLHIGQNQSVGDYIGTYTVSVEYY